MLPLWRQTAAADTFSAICCKLPTLKKGNDMDTELLPYSAKSGIFSQSQPMP
jgi:hypothetical protein